MPPNGLVNGQRPESAAGYSSSGLAAMSLTISLCGVCLRRDLRVAALLGARLLARVPVAVRVLRLVPAATGDLERQSRHGQRE